MSLCPFPQRQRKLALRFCATASDKKEQCWNTESISVWNISTWPCNVWACVEVNAIAESGMRIRQCQNEAAIGGCVSGLSSSLRELALITSSRKGRGRGRAGGGAWGREKQCAIKGQREPWWSSWASRCFEFKASFEDVKISLSLRCTHW